MTRTWLAPVAAALDAAPAPVEVFFRDDDAGWRDDRLLALLDRFAARRAPIDVAAIPLATTPALAEELRARAVAVHQHGLAHANHEPAGRRCEFGPSRSLERQRADIAAGRERLGELLGDALQDPIFTPPWNRCTATTGRALLDLGFTILSREHRAPALGLTELREIPVHVDWVRLAPQALAERMAARIRAGGPLGVMLHHAVMHTLDLSRVDDLLALVNAHERARHTTLMSADGAGTRADRRRPAPHAPSG